MFKNKFFLAILILAILALGIFLYQNYSPGNQVAENFDNKGRVVCINPNLPVPSSLHWHQDLSIFIEGQKVTIPADIGIGADCHRVIHTHDESGEIHIEPNKADTFYLGDFFTVWGQTFNSGQILDKTADSSHRIIMTVNGVQSEEYENLELKDGQQIKIEYKKI